MLLQAREPSPTDQPHQPSITRPTVTGPTTFSAVLRGARRICVPIFPSVLAVREGGATGVFRKILREITSLKTSIRSIKRNSIHSIKWLSIKWLNQVPMFPLVLATREGVVAGNFRVCFLKITLRKSVSAHLKLALSIKLVQVRLQSITSALLKFWPPARLEWWKAYHPRRLSPTPISPARVK